MKLSRTEQREQAFALIFERIFNQEPVEELIENAVEARDLEISAYARSTAEGVSVHVDDLDVSIERFTVGWQKKRLSRVSLAILRLAIYEMHYVADIPVSVSINEAVELAKKYASPEDASFINGLLGSLARSDAAQKNKPMDEPISWAVSELAAEQTASAITSTSANAADRLSESPAADAAQNAVSSVKADSTQKCAESAPAAVDVINPTAKPAAVDGAAQSAELNTAQASVEIRPDTSEAAAAGDVQ